MLDAIRGLDEGASAQAEVSVNTPTTPALPDARQGRGKRDYALRAERKKDPAYYTALRIKRNTRAREVMAERRKDPPRASAEFQQNRSKRAKALRAAKRKMDPVAWNEQRQTTNVRARELWAERRKDETEHIAEFRRKDKERQRRVREERMKDPHAWADWMQRRNERARELSARRESRLAAAST